MGATLAHNQVEIRSDTDDALVVGPGTAYEWSEDGPSWWGPPEVRISDSERAGAHGVTPGRDLLTKHTSTFVVTILGESESDLAAKITAWKAACAVESDDLVAVRSLLLGEPRVRYGRFRIPGEVTATTAPADFTAIGSAQFEAVDALTYADELQSAITGRVTPGTGFIPPFDVPFDLAPATTGSIAVINGGTARAPWEATLAGPLTLPVIEHLESGRRLAFTANGGIDLAAGQTLEIDSRTRAVRLNGTADRRPRLSIESTWWDLEPGTTTFRLTADAGAGSLTVRWRDAYHS